MSLDHDRTESNADQLRLQLKTWEKAFVAANSGRKPGREDIKKDASIAAKYKLYHALQQPSREKLNRTPQKLSRKPDGRDALRERPINNISLTPRKTPVKKISDAAQSQQSPSKEPEPEQTPAFIRCALGPTPQKDGQVLGIFDFTFGATPSKSQYLDVPAPELSVSATPSKNNTATTDSTLSRTPQSSSRRYYLDAFAGTPLKRKSEDAEIDAALSTVSKRRFMTPSFLRRGPPMASIAEDDAQNDHMPAPFRKRGLVRSLSSIIQGLRKQEEKRMDDDWDVLQELEREEDSTLGNDKASKFLVEDSQAPMPLGPDGDIESDEDDVEGDHASTTRKSWKKKGLKRQTRRVIMRPVLNQPKKAAEFEALHEEEDDDAGEVATTQLAHHGTDEEPSDDSDPDVSDSGHTKKRFTSGKESSKASRGTDELASNAPKTRKVSAQAHANFRKLKIKNKNSKANGRGRFGRR